ncbi:hypothetical protein EON63_19540, partial [archaeon]
MDINKHIHIHISGAYAEQGGSLEDLICLGERVRRHMGTLGVALTPCTLPSHGGGGSG